MNDVAIADPAQMLERVLISGDLSKLSSQDRVFYYQKVCESVGLNPLTKPFDYLTLNGRMVLYAKRDATDQLRKIHGVSIHITARETIEGVYVVTAKARDKSGREDESTGAVSTKGLAGDALANALMKAETKAKRRATLSICGLGMLDETEIETIPDSAKGAPHLDARGELGKNVDPVIAAQHADQMRQVMGLDLPEEQIAMRVLDLHDTLRGDSSLYVAASDCMKASERASWKRWVKMAHDLSMSEPRVQ